MAGSAAGSFSTLPAVGRWGRPGLCYNSAGAPMRRGAAVGEVSEWLMVPLSKSGRAQALVGSNPTLSATLRYWKRDWLGTGKLRVSEPVAKGGVQRGYAPKVSALSLPRPSIPPPRSGAGGLGVSPYIRTLRPRAAVGGVRSGRVGSRLFQHPARGLETRALALPKLDSGLQSRGEVLEWPIRRAWRARRAQALVGSNPTLSAILQWVYG